MKNKPTEKIHSSKPLFENGYFWFTNCIPFLICVQFCLASRGWFYSIFNIHPIWPASRGGKTMNRTYNELGLRMLIIGFPTLIMVSGIIFSNWTRIFFSSCQLMHCSFLMMGTSTLCRMLVPVFPNELSVLPHPAIPTFPVTEMSLGGQADGDDVVLVEDQPVQVQQSHIEPVRLCQHVSGTDSH